jgi:small-conductance mechanosensitive channel
LSLDELSPILFITPRAISCALLVQGDGVLQRIWFYVSYPLPFFNDRVSVGRVVLGILLLLLTFALSGRASALLDHRLSQRGHIDAGLRYTIARLIRYLFVVIGVLIALKQFSIDLTSIAVVFTALSVGIGFGLQYIAADIVSGFILLFERPIRVGDRITIGEDEGDVQSINLRTTIVTTNDRIAIIVPNSKLVSQRVINWSYGDPRARISIPVGVAYNSDVKVVSETLLLAADGIEHVLSDPPPKVQFLRFGDYSLDFRLMVWTRHPNRHPQIRSDINFRIERLFRERGIEIPYPTQKFVLNEPGLSILGNDRAAQDEIARLQNARDTDLPRQD